LKVYDVLKAIAAWVDADDAVFRLAIMIVNVLHSASVDDHEKVLLL
jgi:hypothetical protein